MILRQCDAGTEARFPEIFKFNIDEADYENGVEVHSVNALDSVLKNKMIYNIIHRG